MRSSLVLKWIGFIVMLACSHWFTYWLGLKVEDSRATKYSQHLIDSQQEAELRQRVAILRMLAKSPQAIALEDVNRYCKRTLALAMRIEKSAIVPARRAGDDPRADDLQQDVDEARHLVALLINPRR